MLGGSVHRLLLAASIWLAASGLPFPSSQAQVLYDATSGTLPGEQGWGFVALPGLSTQEIVDHAVRLDTTVDLREQAGYARPAPEPLDRTAGFTLLFTVQLHNETHTSPHRAGFSVILLDQANQGIELAFWTDRVFAQSDSPLFVHAEESLHDTVAVRQRYALNLRGGTYRLTADGRPVLSGPLRDYSAFTGVINPYDTPNFIFLGDNTTSGQAEASLSWIALVPPPRVGIESPNLLTWQGVPGATYRVEGSENLVRWGPEASVESATDRFSFTYPITTPRRWFRIVHP